MTYDGADGVVVQFGGNNNTTATNETWIYTAGRWTQLPSGPSPSARRAPAMAYDPAIGRVVLFGGAPGSLNSGLSDTWTFHAGKWHPLNLSTSPPARAAASMVYDPNTRALLMFGGTSNFCCSNAGIGDFWEFTANRTWVQLTLPVLPSQRNDYGFTWDRTLNEALLFGGWQPGGGCGGTLSDTWAYRNGSWSSVPTPRSLGPRQGAGLAWSPAAGAVLFGGLTGSCGTAQVFHSDTLRYWGGAGWHRDANQTGPSPRFLPQFCYDARDGYLLLFGGQNAAGALGDTWVYR